ncbi:hypothetical protein [Niallia sp. 03133]|uniref:hypothetical protein n=1 Tax=Niallia sp. 03133 TaxID=3458060 RepID=UPI004044D946
MLDEKNLVFVYKYSNEENDLIAVTNEIIGYDYKLASIDDLDIGDDLDTGVKWAEMVIVKEGSYKWDSLKKDYIKI